MKNGELAELLLQHPGADVFVAIDGDPREVLRVVSIYDDYSVIIPNMPAPPVIIVGGRPEPIGK